MYRRTPSKAFLFSYLLPLFFRFIFFFPPFRSFSYLVALRHGCIINHAPTFGECHLSRVVDHNRRQGAALSSEAVLYIRTPVELRALSTRTQQVPIKVERYS